MQLTDADQSRYERVCARLSVAVASYPPALRQLCVPALDALLAGEFSQLAALLPAWLSDLIPLDDQRLDALGEAGLWLWWYASVLDGLIDADMAPTALLGAQQALLHALEIYRNFGLADTPAWDDLLARARCTADAYAREVATRNVAIAELRDDQLAVWSPELLMDRSAPFAFSLSAQLELAGTAADDPRRTRLAAALHRLAAARQIADDASDWLRDLQRGQINSVSAGLIGSFRRQRPDQADALSVEQLAGYEIQAEDYWQQIEQTHADLCRQAQADLDAYGECRLRRLILYQQRSDAVGWERMRERRMNLQQMFGQAEMPLQNA